MAILAVASFQLYWLYKNFKEEKQNLSIRTNVLFREAVSHVQMEKLKLDSNIKIRFNPGRRDFEALEGLRQKVQGPKQADTFKLAPAVKSTILISTNASNENKIDAISVFKDSLLEKDSSGRNFRFFTSNTGGVIHLLQNVDSLQDSITVEAVSAKYAGFLQREKINLPFIITKQPCLLKNEELPPPNLENANEVTIGFSNPFTFSLELQNTAAYLLKKMSSQIWVSVLLVGLTIFSFVLLLRNLVQQRKLTQLKNDFISNITHELKTPIATVSVAVEALRDFNALEDPQRTREYLDISSNELQRLSLLVDKVLKLSMFEKQQIELREEAVDLKQLVEEVVASMKLQFEKYQAQVNVHLQGKDFIIKGDRLHVTSVIYNLLDNALKYSKINPSIRVDLIETAGEIEVAVTDNGIGVSPEYQEKIFDKFFRVPTGDTHNVKGYGLGLSYVAYVIQRHHGSIAMESEPGIGSRFTIKLHKTA